MLSSDAYSQCVWQPFIESTNRPHTQPRSLILTKISEPRSPTFYRPGPGRLRQQPAESSNNKTTTKQNLQFSATTFPKFLFPVKMASGASRTAQDGWSPFAFKCVVRSAAVDEYGCSNERAKHGQYIDLSNLKITKRINCAFFSHRVFTLKKKWIVCTETMSTFHEPMSMGCEP